MLTLLLAWINAKYKHNYEGLFIVLFILDCLIICFIFKLLKNG